MKRPELAAPGPGIAGVRVDVADVMDLEKVVEALAAAGAEILHRGKVRTSGADGSRTLQEITVKFPGGA